MLLNELQPRGGELLIFVDLACFDRRKNVYSCEGLTMDGVTGFRVRNLCDRSRA